MSFHQLFRCPYCRHRGSEGVVALDTQVLRALPQGLTESNVIGPPPRSPGRAGVILFNPDGVPNGPCRHLISCLLDVIELGPRRRRAALAKKDFTLSCDHPWFAIHDGANELNAHLWIEVDSGVADAFDPETPYVRHRIEWEAPPSGSPFSITVSGTMYFAGDPERFLAELKDGYERRHGIQRSTI